MKVIIPMAGYGTRLRPHTYSRPKPLINVAGQPMLKHLLASLEGLDIDEYIFIVGYLGDQIENYIKQHHSIKAHFIEQKEMIGQAHAIHLAREYLGGPAIVLFADTLFETDLSIINQTDADAIAFVKQVEDPRRFGVVELNGSGQVTRFVEKPDSMDNKNVVIGLYWLRDSGRMIEAIEKQMARQQMTKGEFYIADAFQIMVEDGAVFRTQKVNMWLDCGKPETVLETNRYLLDHGCDNSHQIAREGVTIISPSYVDPGADIQHAIIGPYATISADCHIRNSIIRDSIIDRAAKVTDSLLDQSLVGEEAAIGGRMRTVNVGDHSSIGFN